VLYITLKLTKPSKVRMAQPRRDLMAVTSLVDANIEKLPKRKVERLHITLAPELKDKLEQMQEDTFSTSSSDVIRDALLVYAGLINEHKKGNEVFLKSSDGTETLYRLFLKG
jgi:hypothetical protein